MQKLILVAATFLFSMLNANSQIYGGFSSGTVGLAGFEIGYSLGKNLHTGITYNPKFGGQSNSLGAGVAGFIGGVVRKSFNESSLDPNKIISIRPFLALHLGLIDPPTENEYGIPGWTTTTTTTYKKSIGGAVGGGAEFLIGSTGRFSTNLEAGLGKMPNALSGIGNTDTTGNANKFTSVFYFQAGVRFYFGKRD